MLSHRHRSCGILCLCEFIIVLGQCIGGANYTNLQKGIHETTEYLEAFLRNLLLNEKNELHNRNLHISVLLNEEKVDIGDTKVDIENGKVDIQDKKVDIDSVLSEKGSDFSVKADIIEPVSGHGKGKYKFKK